MELVRFRIPTLHGQMTVAGIIKRVLPDGRLEVKSQNHGYFIVQPKEIIGQGTTTFADGHL